MVATVVTAKVSNRSAAIPAQSPTLSPTLSAMVAGLRGSSSGMPASTLPTRSPPTSAPLVKMPPPRRAEAARHERVDDGAVVGCHVARADEKTEIERDAEQRQAGDQQPGDSARLERQFEPIRERTDRRLGGAHVGAHRYVHADEAGCPREHRADQKSNRH